MRSGERRCAWTGTTAAATREGGPRAGAWLSLTVTLALVLTMVGVARAAPEVVPGPAPVPGAEPSYPIPETVGAVVAGLPEGAAGTAERWLARTGLRWSGRVATPIPFSALALELPEGIEGAWVRTVSPLGAEPWTYLPTLDVEDGPDAGTAEALTAEAGNFSELLWAGIGTHVEVLVPRSAALDEVRVHLSDTMGLGDGLLERAQTRVAELSADVHRTVADPQRAVGRLLAARTAPVDDAAVATDAAVGTDALGPLDPISALLDELLGNEPEPPPPAAKPKQQKQKKHWTDGFRGSATRPAVTRRSGWGANESWRRGRPSTSRPRFAVVHHTATRNDYSKAEAPGIVRAIYRYHTQNLGWSDIGYNLLIDRYGRVYEGRAGGLEAGVVGAHAQGYNAGSFGVALIGNFEQAFTTRSALRSLTNVVAWQYRVHRIDPAANRTTTHNGRRIATLVGHRDVGSTACPGRHVTKHLPEVRRQVARARR